MDSEQFREFGKTAIDIIANYFDDIRERDVLPSVEPGDVIRVLPESAPEMPEHWEDLILDFNKHIMTSITNWLSPQFHAYFPSGISYPSIVGGLLCNGLGIIGQSWLESPACTELEVVVVSWLAKLMSLPEYFLNSSPGPGGGTIQNSTSESTLVCLLAAKNRLVRKLKAQGIFDEELIKTKFVVYASDQSNSSIEKAGVHGGMHIRLLKSDDNGQLQKETLSKAFKDDKSKGLIPCYVVTCLGTTGTCAFDPLEDLGPICREEGVWLHVDAAFAGTALICPEYKHLLKGIEFVDSFVFNPHKWLLVNFDCSVLWVKDCFDLIRTFDVKGIVDTKENYNETIIPHYSYWQIPASRRFRALKLWFVLKIYGAVGIRNLIRTQINLAKYFENFVKSDNRLIIEPEPSLSVVCFRIRKSDYLTQKLLEYLVGKKKIFMVATTLRNHYTIRFVICSQMTVKEDIDKSWKIIKDGVDYVLSNTFDRNKNSFIIKRRVSLDVERI